MVTQFYFHCLSSSSQVLWVLDSVLTENLLSYNIMCPCEHYQEQAFPINTWTTFGDVLHISVTTPDFGCLLHQLHKGELFSLQKFLLCLFLLWLYWLNSVNVYVVSFIVLRPKLKPWFCNTQMNCTMRHIFTCSQTFYNSEGKHFNNMLWPVFQW